jgi:hypothetical protein
MEVGIMLERKEMYGKNLGWFVLLAGAALAQAWWFLSPGESWLPVLVGPVLVAGTYNVRHDGSSAEGGSAPH